MSPPPGQPLHTASAPPSVARRLDQVVRRIRALHLLAGGSRIVLLVLLALVVLYAADRMLDLPVGVRGLLLAAAVAGLAREAWRLVLRPLLRGPDRLAAARLVESALQRFDGRLVSVLQLAPGAPGSLSRKVHDEAAEVCAAADLRAVLTARPSLREFLRAAATGLVFAALVVLVRPHTDVFVARWTLQDRDWPRDTQLELFVPDAGPAHVVLDDGSLVAARGGVLNVQAGFAGKRPESIELVVRGADGERRLAMTSGGSDRFHGHLTVKAGDVEVSVRGGDDDGDGTRRTLRVLDPPRLDDPEFVLEPPAYLGMASSVVGPEGLSVPEGTRITVRGRTHAQVSSGRLLLAGEVEPIPLTIVPDGDGVRAEGSFVALESDTVILELVGEHGLATPDPSQHALLVRRDHVPALRVYAPARSDMKVTSKAVVLFSVVAEDDHGIASVRLLPKDGPPRDFEADATRAGQYRLVLDLQAAGMGGTLSYALEASDGRQLDGRGPQAVSIDGRRVDVVDDSEVQRLLADRQLRLKEAFLVARDRQARAREVVDDLLADLPAADSPDRVAAAVAQDQVTTRLLREARELCGILDETITNRIDPGPGASAVLERHLADWRTRPVDEAFAADAWRRLAADYAEGRFGRLDVLGRLLGMASLALDLAVDLSPAAHERLLAVRHEPGPEALQAAQEAQVAVQEALDRLLERMDEWEDYQEVLSLVQTLIDEQRTLRDRTQSALRKEP